MLLVSVAGFSRMQVYGAAWDFNDACIDPLSSPLELVLVPRDPTYIIWQKCWRLFVLQYVD